MKLRKLTLLLILFFSVAPWLLIAIGPVTGGKAIDHSIYIASTYVTSLLSDEQTIGLVLSAADFSIAYWFLFLVAMAAFSILAAAMYALFETQTRLWRRFLWVVSIIFLSLPVVQIFCCMRLYSLKSGSIARINGSSPAA